MRALAATLAATAALIAAAPAGAEVEVGERVRDFRITTSNSENISLSDFEGRTVVLEWNNPGCPYVGRHYETGNMQRLQAAARRQGVVWLTINSGAPGKQGHMTGAEANRFVEAQDASPTHYLLDPRGLVGRYYDARTTPQMMVIDGDGVLRYDGAIDDGPRASNAETADARNYVTGALAALRAGRAVDPATTRPYGCPVKYADEG